MINLKFGHLPTKATDQHPDSTMPSRPKRAASVELGDGDFAIKYNKNGRPVRKSAGQKLSPTLGFVDSSAIDQQLLDIAAGDFSESDESEDFDSEAEREAAKKKTKKRKRTPSPTPPPLSPLPPPDLTSEDASPEPFSLDGEADHVVEEPVEPIHLTFNIEKGFSGPLHVQLNLAHRGSSYKRLRIASVNEMGSASTKRKVKSKAFDSSKKGFLSLPPGQFTSTNVFF
jgi:hypothetical protein